MVHDEIRKTTQDIQTIRLMRRCRLSCRYLRDNPVRNCIELRFLLQEPLVYSGMAEPSFKAVKGKTSTQLRVQ